LKATMSLVAEHAESKSASAGSNGNGVPAKALAKANQAKPTPSSGPEGVPGYLEGADIDPSSGEEPGVSATMLPTVMSCRVPKVTQPSDDARSTTAPSQSCLVAATQLPSVSAAPQHATPYVQQVMAPRGPPPRGEAARSSEALSWVRGRALPTEPQAVIPAVPFSSVVSEIRPLRPALPTLADSQQAPGAGLGVLELGAELGSQPLPTLSSRGLYNLTEIFREAAHASLVGR
jgi:hypothetical protein